MRPPYAHHTPTTPASRIGSGGSMILLLTWDPASLSDAAPEGYRTLVESRLRTTFPHAELWTRESIGDRCSDLFLEVIDGPAEGTAEREALEEIMDDFAGRFF